MSILERTEDWGKVIFDKSSMTFYLEPQKKSGNEIPACSEPLVCNLILTSKCNFACPYCYARDIQSGSQKGLEQTLKVLSQSPFLNIVLSGGEPLLFPKDVAKCINELNGKGIVVDTNGTIDLPDYLIRSIIQNEAFIRISLDAPHSEGEFTFRRSNSILDKEKEKKLHKDKIKRIRYLVSIDARLAIQTVVHEGNVSSLHRLGSMIKDLGVRSWFLQPLRSFPFPKGDVSDFEPKRFARICSNLRGAFEKDDFEIHEKRDVRSNSVFLCDRDGILYTQSETGDNKKKLGNISELLDLFVYVSRTDHTLRYAAKVSNKNI